MKILILAKNYADYVSGYYHQDIVSALQRRGESFVYGPGYPGYDVNDTIDDVFAKSPIGRDVDLIAVGTSWEQETLNTTDSDPHPAIDLGGVDVPKVFFLNKEYKKLEEKFAYARRNRFDLICSAAFQCHDWAKETGLRFLHVPFGVNFDTFDDFGMAKVYDLGFTGNLHNVHTDLRYAVKCRLFDRPEVKTVVTPLGGIRNDLLKPDFKRYSIFWSEWGSRSKLARLFLPLRTRWAQWDWKEWIDKAPLLPTNDEYPRFLNAFKCFFSTPGPLDLIGTRYFECMAVKTVLLIPDHLHNGNDFVDGSNCVVFKPDLSDLDAKVHAILQDNARREALAEAAYLEVKQRHTYHHRIDSVFNDLDLRKN